MPKIIILPNDELCKFGTEITAEKGSNLCKTLLKNGIEIEHACDMAKACTTCHVIVRKGYNSVEKQDELEDDLLDRAWGLEVLSRLSCQVFLGDDDIIIEIPKYSINHAKE